jgi:G:T-mismatch repair DNA endonuclease (very short patch repair protein)
MNLFYHDCLWLKHHNIRLTSNGKKNDPAINTSYQMNGFRKSYTNP